MNINLTKREIAVVQQISRGLKNTDIADALGVKQRTIESHISHAMAKTHTRNRIELVLWAHRQGLISFADQTNGGEHE